MLIQLVYINLTIHGNSKDNQLPVCIPLQHISTSVFDDDADVRRKTMSSVSAVPIYVPSKIVSKCLFQHSGDIGAVHCNMVFKAVPAYISHKSLQIRD